MKLSLRVQARRPGGRREGEARRGRGFAYEVIGVPRGGGGLTGGSRFARGPRKVEDQDASALGQDTGDGVDALT